MGCDFGDVLFEGELLKLSKARSEIAEAGGQVRGERLGCSGVGYEENLSAYVVLICYLII